MSFLGLCDGDPLVETLTEVFGANIVRIPEERIQPISVLTSYDGKSAFRGALAPMLVGDPSITVPITTLQMSDVSGKRSRRVDFDLGLTILEGFLKGFGIPSAGIGLKLKGASEVSFTFKDVLRAFVDINLLGRVLTGRTVDKKSPAASIFFQDGKYTFLVIDSVITSSDFAISVDKTSDQGFKLDVPAIQNIVSEAKLGVSVSTTSGYDLVFKGSKHLGFAFSCVRLYLDSNGTITAMPPEPEVPALNIALDRLNMPGHHKVHYSPDRIMLSEKSGMLSWDQ